MAKGKVDFTNGKTDVFAMIDQTKRKSALAMIKFINQALFEGSLVLFKEEAAKGRGTAMAFRSRTAMLRERSRLMKIAGVS